MKSNRAERALSAKHVWPVLMLGLLVGLCAWSYFAEGIVYQILRTDRPTQEKIELTRQFILQFHAFSWLAYLLMVIVEVLVAPLPGAMLYAPGGMIFGGFWGGMLTLLGNTIGAGCACLITRRCASHRIEAWQKKARFRQLSERISGHGFWIILALRINPLTSSDVVSYAAGVTKIPICQVMAGTFIGMAPLCFLQAYFAYRLLTSYPRLLYPGIALCFLYLMIALWLCMQVAPPEPKPSDHPAGHDKPEQA